ncbi:MAG: hypothetical protein ACOCVV_08735 [Marinobacter sp.]
MQDQASFRQEFVRHMGRLGLPVAVEPFEHFSLAVANASQMAAILPRLDDQAPVTELVRRTLGLEKLMVAADYDARVYTAGVISSIALASGECRGDGSMMGQMFRFTFQHQLQFPGWQTLFLMNSPLADPGARNPHGVGQRARLIA